MTLLPGGTQRAVGLGGGGGTRVLDFGVTGAGDREGVVCLLGEGEVRRRSVCGDSLLGGLALTEEFLEGDGEVLAGLSLARVFSRAGDGLGFGALARDWLGF
ncbi:MAG: hypothetical protein AAFQ89_14550 [Cyanobacteria bacterium J06626_18]